MSYATASATTSVGTIRYDGMSELEVVKASSASGESVLLCGSAEMAFTVNLYSDDFSSPVTETFESAVRKVFPFMEYSYSDAPSTFCQLITVLEAYAHPRTGSGVESGSSSSVNTCT